MLRALDRDPHAQRLRELLQRFRAQELSMTAVLQDLQNQLEFWHRETSYLQIGTQSPAEALVMRCRELQSECDTLATELVHVRMAISGASEELAEQEGRLVLRGPLADDLLLTPA